jgi:hypothetical protein
MDTPDAMEVERERVMGTAGEPEYDSGPDVAVDGSIAEESKAQPQSGNRATGRETSRSVFNKLRGILLAPVGLLKDYFWAVLAFVVVFSAILYLVV